MFIECYCVAEGRNYAEYKDALNNPEEKAKVENDVQRLLAQF